MITPQLKQRLSSHNWRDWRVIECVLECHGSIEQCLLLVIYILHLDVLAGFLRRPPPHLVASWDRAFVWPQELVPSLPQVNDSASRLVQCETIEFVTSV